MFASAQTLHSTTKLTIDNDFRLLGPMDGQGDPLVTISGGTDGIIAVTDTTVAAISNLVLAGANAPGHTGAGVSNLGTLTVANSVISGNAGHSFGGVYNAET